MRDPMRIDLNADVGELPGGDDPALIRAVTSASVAAAVHAGTPSLLRETVRRARAAGVAIGAHPGLPDRGGFGRREQHLEPGYVEDLVLYQVSAVAGMASAEGVRLQHVKLHGALYNTAARDPLIASAASRAVALLDPSLIMFGLAGSALVWAAREAGLPVAAEAFADRAYERNGTLVSRDRPGAVITDPDVVCARAVRLVRDGAIEAIDGAVLRIEPDTLCVHGDTPGAGALARRLRETLEREGVSVQSPGVRRGGRGGAPFR
jgi:UPF0271 protein